MSLREQVEKMLSQGYRTTEIARALGCWASYVSRVKLNRYKTRQRRYRRYDELDPLVLDPNDPGCAHSPLPIRIPNDDPLLRRLREHHGASLA